MIYMPSEVLHKALKPVRRMVTRGGKTFMTTVYVGSTKAERAEQPKKVAIIERPSKMVDRGVSRVTVDLMKRTEDVIEFAPSDALAVEKVLAFQRDYFGDRPEPSVYEIVQMATEEVEYARSLGGDTGEQWYEESMVKVRSILTNRFPDMAADTEWDFFLAILAVTSPAMSPGPNLRAAVKVYEEYSKTGKIPIIDIDTDKAYGVASTANLERFRDLLAKYKTKAAFVEFINGVSTSGELRDKGGKVSGSRSEAAFNSMMMGEKVGMFYQSMRGTEGAVTVDRWAIRSFYRWTGRLREGVQIDPDTKERKRIIEDKVSTDDRRAVEYVMQTVGEKLGLSARQVQAVMWYYEKRLYKKLGMAKLAAMTDDFAKVAETMYLQKSVSDISTMLRSGTMPTFREFLAAIMEVKL